MSGCFMRVATGNEFLMSLPVALLSVSRSNDQSGCEYTWGSWLIE